MKNLLPKKSKKGITLVETVIAVVVLAILTTGILSLMTAGGRKILLLSNEASDQAAAAQQLDLVIAAISNGDSRTEVNPYILKETYDEVNYCCLYINELFNVLGLEEDNVTLVATIDLYDSTDNRTISKSVTVGEENVTMTLYPVNNVRGWYLELTYKDATAKGVTVKGFVSNSEGVFDQ